MFNAEDNKTAAEEKKTAAENKFVVMVVLAISFFIAFGLGGIIAFSMGSIPVGLAFHLGWVCLFGPPIYFACKYGKHYEWTWKKDVFRINSRSSDDPAPASKMESEPTDS